LLLCVLYGTVWYSLLTCIGFLSLMALNFIFHMIYMKRILRRDQGLQTFRTDFPITTKSIGITSMILSFKSMRMLYSRFYGLDHFQAQFQSFDGFFRPLQVCTIINAFVSLLPIVLADIVGLATTSWGTQLYITMIETLLLSIAILVLEVIEMLKIKKLIGNDIGYDVINGESRVDSQDDSAMRDKLLELLRRRLMSEGLRRAQSDIVHGSKKEEDDRKVHSWPMSPKEGYEGPFNFADYIGKQPDNVYADSKPADPDAKKGKTYVDFEGQIVPEDIMKRKGGDLLTVDDSDDERRKAE